MTLRPRGRNVKRATEGDARHKPAVYFSVSPANQLIGR
jgi:hypothetical protein